MGHNPIYTYVARFECCYCHALSEYICGSLDSFEEKCENCGQVCRQDYVDDGTMSADFVGYEED